jgi:hypothetical protein
MLEPMMTIDILAAPLEAGQDRNVARNVMPPPGDLEPPAGASMEKPPTQAAETDDPIRSRLHDAESVSDVLRSFADLGVYVLSEGREDPDGRDCDQCENQGVLGKALTALVGQNTLDDVKHWISS